MLSLMFQHCGTAFLVFLFFAVVTFELYSAIQRCVLCYGYAHRYTAVPVLTMTCGERTCNLQTTFKVSQHLQTLDNCINSAYLLSLLYFKKNKLYFYACELNTAAVRALSTEPNNMCTKLQPELCFVRGRFLFLFSISCIYTATVDNGAATP